MQADLIDAYYVCIKKKRLVERVTTTVIVLITVLLQLS